MEKGILFWGLWGMFFMILAIFLDGLENPSRINRLEIAIRNLESKIDELIDNPE